MDKLVDAIALALMADDQGDDIEFYRRWGRLVLAAMREGEAFDEMVERANEVLFATIGYRSDDLAPTILRAALTGAS